MPGDGSPASSSACTRSTTNNLHWELDVEPGLSTPGEFLFGGCGLAAGIVSMEKASGRPTVWATAQYLSFAPTHSHLEFEVVLAAVGRRTTQARSVGHVGDNEILTVNAALGARFGTVVGNLGRAAEGRPARELPGRVARSTARCPRRFSTTSTPVRRWAGPSRR